MTRCPAERAISKIYIIESQNVRTFLGHYGTVPVQLYSVPGTAVYYMWCCASGSACGNAGRVCCALLYGNLQLPGGSTIQYTSKYACPRMHGGPPSQVRVARGGSYTLHYIIQHTAD